MKKIILFLLSVGFLFSFVKLQEEKIFYETVTKKDNLFQVDIKTKKDVYLYKEQLKLFINGTNIIQKLSLPKTTIEQGKEVFLGGVQFSVPFSIIENEKVNIKLEYQGCSKQGICYAPMVKDFEFTIPKQEQSNFFSTLKNGNLWLVLSTFFGIGVLLSLTPCTFPMIPILSGIIINHSRHKKVTAQEGFVLSLVYVVSASITYAIVGLLVGLFGIKVTFQDPVSIGIFTAILVALALSMFGYYKLELPKSWQNKIDRLSGREGKKGILSIAVMGFLSALIVGPCVAPALGGALLYISQTGDALLGGMALFVLSFGMGIPLLFIGAGSGKYLPKPGIWMQRISNIFGVILLALAIWMLSRVVPVSVSILLYSILFIFISVYLRAFESLGAKVLGIIFLVYGIMLFVGALSGTKNMLNPLDVFTAKNYQVKQEKLVFKKVKTLSKLQNIIKTSQQPILVDFWASWCVSCKELNNITFTHPQVINKLKNYQLIKIDVTNNTNDDKKLMKHFQVFGPPALILFENGRQIEKIIGFIKPEDFLGRL
jgi:thiol:disulfide interchange protein DsbD